MSKLSHTSRAAVTKQKDSVQQSSIHPVQQIAASYDSDGAISEDRGVDQRSMWEQGRNPYFFFSLWIVCLRRRAQYLLKLNFGVPDFLRMV